MVPLSCKDLEDLDHSINSLHGTVSYEDLDYVEDAGMGHIETWR